MLQARQKIVRTDVAGVEGEDGKLVAADPGDDIRFPEGFFLRSRTCL